jgi:hypothetical protein
MRTVFSLNFLFLNHGENNVTGEITRVNAVWSFSLCNLLLHCSVTSTLFCPNILLRTLFSKILSICYSHDVSDQFLHTWQKYGSVYINLSIHGQQEGRQKTELNGIKHSPNLVCSYYFHVYNFDLSALFPNIWTLSHLQRTYSLSLCCAFVLLSENIALTYTFLWIHFQTNLLTST